MGAGGDTPAAGPHDTATPNLPSRSFDVTEDFYHRFGFIRRHRDEGWMILRRGSVQLEFFPQPDLDPWTSSFGACLRVADVDELYDAVLATGVPVARTGMPRLHPVVRESWGQRAGALIDPDGSLLRLIEQGD